MGDDDIEAGQLVELKVIYGRDDFPFEPRGVRQRPNNERRPGTIVNVDRDGASVVVRLHVRDETDGQVLGALRDGGIWRVVMPGLSWPGHMIVQLRKSRSLSRGGGSGSTPS